MVNTICILTATRAEYSILKPVIDKLMDKSEFNIKIAVTGAHLSPEFGHTYQEIEKDKIEIDTKIDMLVSADTPAAITKSMGLALISFADYFQRTQPDLLVVLGDRYETLAVCIAAMNQQIPIAHLYGGETTEGAIDESIRHAITKISYLHFTSTDTYRNRVIQLGENPNRVFTVGALGIENILNQSLLTKVELESAIKFKLDKPYAMVTFHPVTLEANHSKEQTMALLAACEKQKDMKFIFTKANADANGRIINQLIDEYCTKNKNAIAYTSLGMKSYLSGLKYSNMVIGNSSSGLIEAPSFNVPTINIGDRQKGRLQAESVINCKPDTNSISKAINTAKSSRVQAEMKYIINPYGDGKSSEKIVKVLTEFLLSKKMNLQKQFYDCEVKK
ncbi:UDP-N-acetylglucosamine 2-epimerase [Planococcus sp. A6]|uniref:UDP-N-acetylglucosamine 2-epimerase n=1 Tax=Planococcus sp. A6 TaxID=2992760 RepID=UPI00237B1E51|nr:UDP-N-acetylglucosamine 2-epimerase [Planococcus sp. A6]MDE0582107.1 UDP-N-acetylglucosamine 2-epimerase [Planococcus sp. A6]